MGRVISNYLIICKTMTYKVKISHTNRWSAKFSWKTFLSKGCNTFISKLRMFIDNLVLSDNIITFVHCSSAILRISQQHQKQQQKQHLLNSTLHFVHFVYSVYIVNRSTTNNNKKPTCTPLKTTSQPTMVLQMVLIYTRFPTIYKLRVSVLMLFV